MAIGPFITYVPPGVYTRTLTEANVSNVTAGIRIPVIIGVGQQSLEQDNVELVRGSSGTVDEQIVNEDETASWVVNSTNPNNLILGAQNGTYTTFRVSNYPITDGQGFGLVTNKTTAVTVTVNGVPVVVAQLQGQKGLISLQLPTQPTDIVAATYFFHRGDTYFTDDVSAQVTSTNASLISPGYEPFNIVTGTNDTFAVTANGVTGTVTLPPGALTASAVAAVIMAAAIPNLLASVFTDNDGLNHVQLTSTQNISVGTGNANGPLGFTSGAATSRNTRFRVFEIPITDGSGSGITTTDPTKVVVKVNSIQVVASSVDGQNGIVTLPFAPASGSAVAISYWSNTWQQTFDYLPNSQVSQVLLCGISPGRNDFVQGADFTISNPSVDVSVVNWGAAVSVAASTTSPGATPITGVTGSGGQVSTTLIDEKYFLAVCSRVTNTTVIPAVVSATQFTLPEVPTTGNGRDTPLGLPLFNSVANGRQDLISNRPDLVTVYAGRTLVDAINKSPIPVTQVDGPNRLITLQSPIPPDWTVFATFWYNLIIDDTAILTCTVPGPIGTGQYTLFSSLQNKNLWEIRFGTTSGLSTPVQWPRGVETIPDAFMTGAGTPVAEIVTATFGQSAASNAVFTNHNAEPYSIFTPYSANWTTLVNSSPVLTNLAGAARGYLISSPVTPIQSGVSAGDITIPTAPNNVLNISIDGVTIAPITLTSGAHTPASIVTAINAAIDANVAFSGTAPNNLASFVQIGPNGPTVYGNIVFIIKSYSTPAALPGGFDSPSQARILQGTVQTTLGYSAFQTANGTPGAINKPATLLGGLIGPFNITTGLNDNFLLTVNGTAYQVTLPGGTAVTASAVVAAIDAVPGLSGVASVGTLANLNKIRLTSPTNDSSSILIIGNGSANAPLGFVQNQSASQTQVLAQEIVDELNATSGFASGAVAYVDNLNGGNYITIESLVVGAAGSNIGFVNSANSAFNPTTNVGLTPGVDGDDGEDPHDQYVVSSSNPGGSRGVGIPGQTYTDAQTGLRFTVMPASTGSYTPGGTFTLLVSNTFHVDPSNPRYAIGGVEMLVSNLNNVGVGDTGTVATFNPGGIEPAVGDFYFISYLYNKQDYSTRIFQTLATIEANFGAVAPNNTASLGAYLCILNGAVLIGIKQVLVVPGTGQASDTTYINAIQSLSTPLPGNVKPDIIIPLTGATSVAGFLTNFCETQSNIRNQAECIGFIGFSSGTSASNAQAVTKSLVSSRIIAFYPDSSTITLTDETGATFNSIIDGTFFGAAVAGVVVSPSVDVATPYTHRRIQGFTQLNTALDPVTANQTAVAGITLIEDLGNGFLRIRQGLTTNMANILTRLPTVTQIADFVQQQSRAILDSYVGLKFLAARTNEVVVTMTGLFKSLVQAEIVGAFTGMSASIDPADPTILDFTMYYSPIFPLEYLVLTFNLRANV
jgi:hypothetical protein